MLNNLATNAITTVDSAGTNSNTSKARVEPCCYCFFGNALQQHPNGGEVLTVQMYGTTTYDESPPICNASHDVSSALSIGALIKQRADPSSCLPLDPDQNALLEGSEGHEWTGCLGTPSSPTTAAGPPSGRQSDFHLSATCPARSRGLDEGTNTNASVCLQTTTSSDGFSCSTARGPSCSNGFDIYCIQLTFRTAQFGRRST